MKTADLYRVSDVIGAIALTVGVVVLGCACVAAWVVWRVAP